MGTAPTRALAEQARLNLWQQASGRQKVTRDHEHTVQVLTLVGSRVARITAFDDPSLVPTSGLALARP